MKGIIFIISLAFLASCSSNQISSKEKKASLYYSHGTQKLIAKEYTDALENLMKANELNPNDSKTLNNLAMAYYFKGEEKEAIKLLKEAIEINNKNSDAKNNLASIYFNLGKVSEAKKVYQTLLKDLLYRNQFRTHYNLGLIELRYNNLTKAINHFEKASGLRADYCAADYMLGQTYERVKKLNLSVKYYKKASSQGCAKNPEPLYGLANLYAKLGKDNEAIEIYNQIITNFPKHQLSFKASKRKRMLKKELEYTRNRTDAVKTINSGDF